MAAITITDEAKNKIHEILKDNGKDAIIIGVTKTGCNGNSYKIDFCDPTNVHPLDEIIEIGKDKKVIVDNKAFLFLFGSVMDWREDKLSSRFVWDNPKQTATCGCGESFST